MFVPREVSRSFIQPLSPISVGAMRATHVFYISVLLCSTTVPLRYGVISMDTCIGSEICEFSAVIGTVKHTVQW